MMDFETAVAELRLRDAHFGNLVPPEEVREYLEDDVKEAVRRPGSWESGKVRGIMSAHDFSLPDSPDDAYGISLAVGRLQEDVVLAAERPDSWEAAKILDLLQSSGLEPGGVGMEF